LPRQCANIALFVLGSSVAKADLMPAGRVLVVSGDSPVRESVAAILRGEGDEVVTAATVVEGAALLDSFTPDALLVDLSPSVPIGSDLFRQRQVRGIPLLLISAWSEGATAAAALNADAFLPFPILVSALSVALERIRAPRAARGSASHASRDDRRGASRPELGDQRACRRCGHVMRFQAVAEGPAWVCRNEDCLRMELVRVH
jgi:DNA-binding NtrC family response regulator